MLDSAYYKDKIYLHNRLKYANDILPMLKLHNRKTENDDNIKNNNNNPISFELDGSYYVIRKYFSKKELPKRWYYALYRRLYILFDIYCYKTPREILQLTIEKRNYDISKFLYEDKILETSFLYPYDKNAKVHRDTFNFLDYTIYLYRNKIIKANYCNICRNRLENGIHRGDVYIKYHKIELDELINKLVKVSNTNIDVIRYIFEFL